MTSFILKIIGIISMLCDHVSYTFFGQYTILNSIGRFAFPIFAFQISQSYIHTKDIKKYILRLFMFACISQIPFMLFLKSVGLSYRLNIFFTLLLGLIAILCYDKIKNWFLKCSCIFFILIVARISVVDYSIFGVAIILLFYFFYKLYSNPELSIKKQILYKSLMCVSFILVLLVYYLKNFITMPDMFLFNLKKCIFTSMPLLFILLYNGKQGPKMKYLFYWFYPVHLFLLWLISYIR